MERATRVIDTRVSDYRVNVFFHDFHPRFLPPLFLINPPPATPAYDEHPDTDFDCGGSTLADNLAPSRRPALSFMKCKCIPDRPIR